MAIDGGRPINGTSLWGTTERYIRIRTSDKLSQPHWFKYNFIDDLVVGSDFSDHYTENG